MAAVLERVQQAAEGHVDLTGRFAHIGPAVRGNWVET